MALILASVCAELVLMPIGAFVFQRVTIAGLVVNLAAVPCMAVVQVAAMVTAASDAVGLEAIADVAGWVTHVGVRGLIDSAFVVDAAPWLTWRVPSPSMWLVAVYYVLLIALVVGAHLSVPVRRALGVMTAAIFVWIAISPPTLSRRFGDGRLHLTMIDVGQGDAMLVTLPNGRTLFVDTGGVSIRGDFDIGDRVIGPALRARGMAGWITSRSRTAIPITSAAHSRWSATFRPAEVWEGVFVNDHEPTRELRGDGGAAAGGLACAPERRSTRPRGRRAAHAPPAVARLGAAESEE